MASLLRPVLLLLALLVALITAQTTSTSTSTTSSTSSSTSAKPTVQTSLPDNSQYAYLGCYNETTGVSGTGGARALAGGASEVPDDGTMTVPLCLAFCADRNGTAYRYAGLEYSRECWCAQLISGASEKLADGLCDLPCDGNASTVCGGALRLTVYELSAAAPMRIAYGAAAVAVVGTVVFGLL